MAAIPGELTSPLSPRPPDGPPCYMGRQQLPSWGRGGSLFSLLLLLRTQSVVEEWGGDGGQQEAGAQWLFSPSLFHRGTVSCLQATAAYRYLGLCLCNSAR